MPLNDRVGEVFLANRPAPERAAFSGSLARFLVEDIGTTDREPLSVVLLVESPHTHEVGYRYPLAGTTGRRVRGFLNEANILPDGPIGRFVLERRLGRMVNNDRPAFLRLGIMNVSQLPFLSEAYDCIPWEADDCRNHEHWDSYINHMKTIKESPCVSSDNREIAECRELDSKIAEDLGGRLECLHENYPDVLLVRCGGVAQAFYAKTGIHMPNPCDLPHPSRSDWLNLGCQEQQQCLQNIRELLWPLQPGA